MAIPARAWVDCVLCTSPYHHSFLKDGLCPNCQSEMPPDNNTGPDPTEAELNLILGTEEGPDVGNNDISQV